MDAKEILKRYFGYESYKHGQEEIIESILAGKDVLAVMATGAGKSICYQVPAVLLPGLTIVISPLISLMQDQVKALNESGICAEYINSSLTEEEISMVYTRALEGKFKILYVAPERLENSGFINFMDRINISMVTVDEAHCISQWGQDFRPSYVKIVDFIDRLTRRPIVSAFTATATEEVKNDISAILKLQAPKVVITGFDRENLFFEVETVKKDEYVLGYIQKHPADSGIIYCATRKTVDRLYELLKKYDVAVARYHAGIDIEDRKNSQNDFIYDKIQVIVATNAFGMGIDKSNVRYVIHYNMPQSMENYYQEAGRAGRDGEPAHCILLFAPQDVMINRFLLDNKEFVDISPEDIESLRTRDIRRLQIMEGYCYTWGCLRNYILEYFGEKRDEPCNSCGNCHKEYTEIDMTEAAKQVINCVWETRGRYGTKTIIGTLRGANRARLKELGTIHYKSYGVLKNYSDSQLRLLTRQLIIEGYITQTADKYSVMQLGNIKPLNNPNTHVIVRVPKDKLIDCQSKRKDSRSMVSLTNAGHELFEQLRQLRLALAREEGLPPYIIFSDKTLIDMSVKLPCDKEAMLNVSGIGEVKYEKYGKSFIEIVKEFLCERPDVVTITGHEDVILAGKAENIFDRVDYNRKHNKRDRAGRSWSDNEDKQLDNEYNSGMDILNIAKIHSRTLGAIRSRLKKHGFIE